MSFDCVLWDLDDDPEGNVVHCGMNGVSREEVEEVYAHPIAFDVSHSSGRPVVFGFTSTGRHLMVVYEEVDGDTVYTITAYDVPVKRSP